MLLRLLFTYLCLCSFNWGYQTQLPSTIKLLVGEPPHWRMMLKDNGYVLNPIHHFDTSPFINTEWNKIKFHMSLPVDLLITDELSNHLGQIKPMGKNKLSNVEVSIINGESGKLTGQLELNLAAHKHTVPYMKYNMNCDLSIIPRLRFHHVHIDESNCTFSPTNEYEKPYDYLMIDNQTSLDNQTIKQCLNTKLDATWNIPFLKLSQKLKNRHLKFEQCNLEGTISQLSEISNHRFFSLSLDSPKLHLNKNELVTVLAQIQKELSDKLDKQVIPSSLKALKSASSQNKGNHVFLEVNLFCNQLPKGFWQQKDIEIAKQVRNKMVSDLMKGSNPWYVESLPTSFENKVLQSSLKGMLKNQNQRMDQSQFKKFDMHHQLLVLMADIKLSENKNTGGIKSYFGFDEPKYSVEIIPTLGFIYRDESGQWKKAIIGDAN
jgi:hypothetical protein